MDATQLEQLGELFEQVRALQPEARSAFLDQAGRDDAVLRAELISLLASYEAAPDCLEALAGEVLPAALSALAEASPEDVLAGQQIAHYEILGRLGVGGMGVVYKAYDRRLDRLVALKFLPAYLAIDEAAREHLLNEARAASALDHPNICTIYDIGEANPGSGLGQAGRLFLAMAYYEGETLKQKIARGPLPLEETLALTHQIAEGLRAAHHRGVIHRDIKPSNVVITGEGMAKMLDFGIAQVRDADLTQEGTTLGTVAYMSPEQTRGAAVDRRTDLWSLGVVLYEMLTGQRPFRGQSDRTAVHAIRHDEPEPVEHLRPEIPGALADVVAQCLRKDPAARYQQAENVLAALRTVEAGPAQRSRVRSVVVAALLIVLLPLALTVGRSLLTRPEPSIRSIAVLPVTTPADTDATYLAEGTTDLLINQLSQISGLDRVSSRTSVMPYRDTDKAPQEIGQELGVDALVEASVLQEGERMRIDVHLIEVRTGRRLWRHSLARPVRDILALQREVTQEIAQEIKVQLSPQEAARLQQNAPAVNPEALALYLQANRGGGRTPPQEQVASLQQAVALDSSFATAYALLAERCAVGLNDYACAEEAVERALALDPNLPQAHVALGIIRQWVHSDWAGAEAALRRAIELAPLDALAHHELAILQMRVGRFEEALAVEHRALYLDPRSSHYQEGLGEIYLNSGRYAEAIREFETTRRMHPARARTPVLLGDAYFFMGRHDEAVHWYEQSSWGIPVYAYAALSRRAEAKAVLDAMLARVDRGELYTTRNLAGNLAMLYASLGEHDEALRWLEHAADERLGWLPVDMRVTPRLSPLHDEPRFQALLEKMGLAN